MFTLQTLVAAAATARTYATCNPADKGASVTLSNGNLTAVIAGASTNSVRATQGKSSGKWYWEITYSATNHANNQITPGIANSSASLSQYIGQNINGWCMESNAGDKINNGVSGAYGVAYDVGDVVGVALDLDNGEIYFHKNGTWQNASNPVTRVNPAYTGLTGTLFPAVGNAWDAQETVIANFGATAFAYSVPAGFNPGVFI